MPKSHTRRRFLSRTGAACAAGIVTTNGLSTDASATPQSNDSELETYVDRVVNRAKQDHDIDGLAVSVASSNAIQLSKGYGHAFHSEDIPVRADKTLFRIGSVSKALTWTAAMQLIDQGEIASDIPVNDALTSLAIPQAYDKPIRLWHLATHTAGFEARPFGNAVNDPEHVRPLAESVSTDIPSRVRPPGVLPQYTNYAAALGGQLIADVSGQPFEKYIRQNIFEPLGMTQSTFQPAPRELVPEEDTDVTDVENFYSDVAPASGMCTTGTDMARFMQAHLNADTTNKGRILSADAVETMHQQWYTAQNRLDGMAFGLFEKSRGDRRLVRHSGAAFVFSGELSLIPDDDTGLFVVVHGADASAARQQIVDEVLKALAPVPGTRTPIPGQTPTRADELVGRYRSINMTDSASWGKIIYGMVTQQVDVQVADNGLLITKQGGTTDRWVEVEPLVFEHIRESSTVAFQTSNGEPDGEITHLLQGVSAYEKVAPYEQTSVQGGATTVAVATSLIGVVGWPVTAIWRRYRSTDEQSQSLTEARWIAGGSIACLFVFVSALILLAITLSMTGQPSLFNRQPAGFNAIFAIRTGGAVLAIAALGYAVQAWYRRAWSLPARIHYTAVAIAVITLYMIAHYWNLLWF